MSVDASISPGELSEMLKQAKKVVALTGAGLSTSAGIPDFRGPKGLYVSRRYDPQKVFEISWFRRDPSYFYEFAWDFATMASEITPTFSHEFLCTLSGKGILCGIVTQNIDLLHQEAGSERVIELHGSFGSATCLKCGQRFFNLTYRWWLDLMGKSPDKPVARCGCKGVLKPDIVFFGEAVYRYDEAEELIRECDLLLVLGSSLNVTPASLLPYVTNAPTIIINRGSIGLGTASHRHLVNADLDDYLKEVAHSMEIAR
ncbi:Sir2 family NAD-dependent protein deacetylase [Geomonas sp. RF6]|uniref:SIR2 family NAD-dependent protein deacylase n=1 Tax=Geomonas sp. RF6 TaxID=2897342 RepID=UPI001E2F234B|nr:Sir2 family NAD-dependent protein deacetylase [Geomonas sp. RF6]UFS69577.1 Sir2 family NAD-dependent protein deacetylase [Geomonas sp. RF6]